MILDKYVSLKWCTLTKRHYVNKGYRFTKIGDYFDVKIEDLSKACSIKINCKCDFCGKKFQRSFYKLKSVSGKHSCGSNDCEQQLRKINSLIKHGTDHPSKSPRVRQKTVETFMTRYDGAINASQVPEFHQKAVKSYDKSCGKITNPEGYRRKTEKAKRTYRDKADYDNPFQDPRVKEKIKQTNIARYNVPYPTQNEEIKKKIIDIKSNYTEDRKRQIKQKTAKTNLERYDAENIWGSEYGKRKIRETNIERYGSENPMGNSEIRQKMVNSLYAGGNIPSSKNQRHICKLLNGILNFPLNGKSLDIALVNDKIDVEYDGSGHYMGVKFHKITLKQAKKDEKFRERLIINNGWKIIRIISSKDRLFSDEKLSELITKCKSYLINNQDNWIAIDIDSLKIISKKFNCDLTKEGDLNEYNQTTTQNV